MIALAITGGLNVSRNNRLAACDWSTFLTEWIVANHLRTACCATAATSYTKRCPVLEMTSELDI